MLFHVMIMVASYGLCERLGKGGGTCRALC